MLRFGLAAKMPMYTHKMDRITQVSDTAANLLTNATPMKTMIARIIRRTVPYRRKLLVTSPNRFSSGAMYI